MLEFGDWKHKTEVLVDAGREGRWKPKIPISWTASSVEIENNFLHIVVMEANLLRSDVFIGQASISLSVVSQKQGVPSCAPRCGNGLDICCVCFLMRFYYF